ncbi:hypothetical protein LSAT2_017855 [Lamellibrachia satsuma]|nr:hypothetical protein LSAT2_017855 [Lamellibrachia satsuma]
MAEFGYDGKVMETFPLNQAVPRRSAYMLKVYAMPILYWYMLLKGYWNGPNKIRKVFHFMDERLIFTR